jgi:uncharacterized membrane protein YfcA
MLGLGLLACAAFFAGVLNTVAGACTFLTLPALVFVGVPVVMVNATARSLSRRITWAGRPAFATKLRPCRATGSSGRPLQSCSADRSDRGFYQHRRTRRFGRGSLFAVDNDMRLRFAKPIQTRAARRRFAPSDNMAMTILVAIYGGYFSGGLGIVLLALFAFQWMRDLDQMNGLKNGVSLLISAISVVTFSLAGLVVWLW